MTKTVRIENADTNKEKRILIQAQDQVATDDGQKVWINIGVNAELAYPTALATLTLWETRRYVITEAAQPDPFV